MTQAQIQAINDAQAKFQAAEAVFTEAQVAAVQSAAATQAAKNALPQIAAQAQKLINDGNDAYTQAMAAQNTVFATGVQATGARDLAQAELIAAVNAAVSTPGAVEMINSNQTPPTTT